MVFEAFNPDDLFFTSTSSHGMLAPAGGRLLFIAGQHGCDQEGRFPNADGLDALIVQFHWALQNVLRVVQHLGGGPESLGQLTITVDSSSDFRATEHRLFDIYRQLLGPHRPALSVIEAAGFPQPGARVLIQGIAIVTEDDLSDDLLPFD